MARAFSSALACGTLESMLQATGTLGCGRVGEGSTVLTRPLGVPPGLTALARRRLLINGEARKLVGWNHHTQWPSTGLRGGDVTASPTDAQLDSDLALLRAAGANLVRGAHYPQDPRWLDRLDEAGILAWSETLGPGVSLSDALEPAWRRVQRVQLDEMLDGALNHASVFVWAWFNEGPSDQGAIWEHALAHVRSDMSTRANSHSNCTPSAVCVG